MKSFMELAKERYSVRKFKNQPVEEEKIRQILDAAALAPTACNNQPQKVFVLKSADALEKINKATPCIYGAPLVFVIGYDEALPARGMIYDGFDFGQVDTSIVTAHMVLEAWDIGLGSCWVGRFDEAEVKGLLGLPENIRVCHILPVGYADCPPSLRHSESRPVADWAAEM